MAAITVPFVKIRLGISADDTSEDAALTALVPQCQALAEKALGFALERSIDTVYLDGTGREWVTLPRKPVTIVTAEGDTTISSTTISGLPAATVLALVAGMPVVGDNIPAGATVVSATGTSCVISSAATATASDTWITFGMAVWLDTNAGMGGQGADGFADDTLLTPGVDYTLRGTTTASGGVIVSNSGLLWRPSGWERPSRRKGGLLARYVAGPLPDGGQNIKCVYTPGYAPGTIPADIQLGLIEVLSLARAFAGGAFLTSESFDGYSYSRQLGDVWQGYMAGPGGAMLNRYKRLPV